MCNGCAVLHRAGGGIMEKKRKKRIRDLVEMLEDPDETSYIGEDKDQMDIYDEELARLEEEGEADSGEDAESEL